MTEVLRRLVAVLLAAAVGLVLGAALASASVVAMVESVPQAYDAPTSAQICRNDPAASPTTAASAVAF
jgi:hypothetical protein